MSCGCNSNPCCCTPLNLCQPADFGGAFPSLVGPAGPPGGPGTYAASYDTLRAIDATVFTNGYIAYVMGGETVGDGGQGYFQYLVGDSSADNNGTILAPTNNVGRWHRIYTGPVEVIWFLPPLDGTDATTAVQSALEASPAGGTVSFPLGTVSITTIELNKGLRLVGKGMYASTIQRLASASGNLSDLLFFNGDGTAMPLVQLEGLGFDHVGSGLAGSVYSCVTIYTANNVVIKDCYFTRGQYHGVKLNGCLNVLVQGSYFYQCFYDGIGVGGLGGLPLDRRSEFVQLVNNTFEDVYGGAVIQVGIDYVVVSNNQFLKSGLQFAQDVTKAVVTGNVMSQVNTYGYIIAPANQGIFMEADTDAIIANNWIGNINTGSSYGIWIDGSDLSGVQMPANQTVIRDNFFTDLKDTAIFVTAASTTGTPGIQHSIMGNHVYACGQGILVTGVTGLSLLGNYIYEVDFTAVTIAATQFVVSGNQIFNPGASAIDSYYGIDLDTTVSQGWLIHNTIVDARATKRMRFGVFDRAVNAGSVSNVKHRDNHISGAVSGLYFPAPAIPVAGTWSLGDTLQTFAQGSPGMLRCLAAGTPGVWYSDVSGQVGLRSGNASPAGSIVPIFVGEEFFDEVNDNWYKSTGLTNADWKQISN